MTDPTGERVSTIALGVKERLPDLVPSMVELFIENIPEFRHDETVRPLMVASTASNLECFVDMLILGISLEDVQVPPAAAHYARRFAQLDMSLEALLRAYRLGERLMLRWFIDGIEPLGLTTGDALAATRWVAAVVNGYIDHVIENLVSIYADERRRWDERSDATRAARIRAVLATDDLETAVAEEMLGVSLRGWNVAAVAWVSESGQERALRVVGRVVSEVTGRSPLGMDADSATVWLWLRYPAPALVDTDLLAARLTEHPGLRMALGDPGAGLDGFRTSHEEAQRARRVAEMGGAVGQQVFRHSEVALAGLLADQRDEVRVWVRRTLGGLAAQDDSSTRLRETLRVFLERNGSFTDAAASMHLHKNTVLYRVRKAEEILGHPIGEGRLSTEVALQLYDQLALAAPVTT